MVPSHPVLLATTAAESAPGSVRVVWVASSVAELAAPPGGVLLDKLDDLASKDAISPHIKYSISKACNYLQGTEYARRFGNKGIPPDRQRRLHAALAGLSPEVGLEKNGAWTTKPESEGGSGIAQEFWAWNEKQVQQYS
ncbi:hypothetical protein MGG_15236 [Pyricularia oryzae 70-15]|uniref:Uncharacterized protein n=1 Tax=Pyricularia oryzae (strain 70-15 / ATCC MYA-4617 / FGSC 8958) TaxID=242507 RepID=G4N491_PYRO7|nr:uncharacterized protein MGG_15236 [Pyricularia oryzae 70-15]EHA51959.1 hypothetical protein MGG_15236 [Pyricularia oryzae 70-15]